MHGQTKFARNITSARKTRIVVAEDNIIALLSRGSKKRITGKRKIPRLDLEEGPRKVEQDSKKGELQGPSEGSKDTNQNLKTRSRLILCYSLLGEDLKRRTKRRENDSELVEYRRSVERVLLNKRRVGEGEQRRVGYSPPHVRERRVCL